MKALLVILVGLLALTASMIWKTPWPLSIFMFGLFLILAIKDVRDGVHRPSYDERHLTDAFAADGAITNLRGVPARELLSDETSRHRSAQQARDFEDWNTDNHTKPPAVS